LARGRKQLQKILLTQNQLALSKGIGRTNSSKKFLSENIEEENLYQSVSLA
jgi:hypothetical protein